MASRLEALQRVHDVGRFDCGVPVLNHWLRHTASQHQKKGTSRTWVLVDDRAPDDVIGFFALAPRGLVLTDTLPDEMRKRMPQVVAGYTLARLAVTVDKMRQGHGAHLLNEAMEKAWRVARQVGGFGLFVDAKEGAASFYAHFGFEPFPDDPDTLVLRLSDIGPYPLHDPDE